MLEQGNLYQAHAQMQSTRLLLCEHMGGDGVDLESLYPQGCGDSPNQEYYMKSCGLKGLSGTASACRCRWLTRVRAGRRRMR